MIRGLFFLFLFSAIPAFSGTVQPLPPLPAGTIPSAVQVDASGNIYVAGSSPSHAFVGKLSPDGSQIIWWTVLAGSQSDSASALALGADNSVYVTGTTNSLDFATTPSSMQPTTSVVSQAFAAKLSPSGAVVYATYIGGSAQTNGRAIAVDSAGDAFITGGAGSSGLFPTSPGAVTGATTPFNGSSYIVKLNPAGSAALVSISGFGGNAIAIDPQDNIYAAGAFASAGAPTTPGAFQPSATPSSCEFDPYFASFSSCAYQHIAKINPNGTHLIYATYLDGSNGAVPTAMTVDSAGNVIVAGSTGSPDYPTNPSAYQPEFSANPEFGFESVLLLAPATAGYISKLNASGTGLLWSTLFSGSSNVTTLPLTPVIPDPPDVASGESITGLAIDVSGNILFSGIAQSPNVPGLWSTPVASRPPGNGEGFVARLSPDGTTLSPTQLITGRAVGIAARSDGSAVVAGTQVSGGSPVALLATVSLSSVGRVTWICDTADAAKIVSVAPGQLMSLYGTALAPGPAIPLVQFPTSLNGVTVIFNGIAAPILYTSTQQINLQVPYEIAGLTEVTMQVTSTQRSPPLSESYILAVVASQPSVFIAGPAFSQPLFDMTACNGQTASGLQPVALNADGTQNSCTNPAASGSTITIFLNGLGLTAPAQTTGTVSPSLVAINPVAAVNATEFQLPAGVTANFLSTTTDPGWIDSVIQVQIQVTSKSSPVTIPLEVRFATAAYWVRGPGILVWVK